jgi:hypothetical protein
MYYKRIGSFHAHMHAVKPLHSPSSSSTYVQNMTYRNYSFLNWLFAFWIVSTNVHCWLHFISQYAFTCHYLTHYMRMVFVLTFSMWFCVMDVCIYPYTSYLTDFPSKEIVKKFNRLIRHRSVISFSTLNSFLKIFPDVSMNICHSVTPHRQLLYGLQIQ